MWCKPESIRVVVHDLEMLRVPALSSVQPRNTAMQEVPTAEFMDNILVYFPKFWEQLL